MAYRAVPPEQSGCIACDAQRWHIENDDPLAPKVGEYMVDLMTKDAAHELSELLNDVLAYGRTQGQG